ncbi:MAG: adenylosuccinate lyase [Candidatus Thorarchaeota archaeon]
MPVCPIDYGRYGHHDMVSVFEEEFRHELWLRVEATVAEVEAEMGLIPRDAADDIRRACTPEVVTLTRTMQIEEQNRHDVAALFEAIAEKCHGPGKRWVHYGLTSNDVKDTALGLQLKSAFGVLLPQLDRLIEVLKRRAQETVDLVTVGRTHGQHAVPTTYGLRFAVWIDEMYRHRRRLIAARDSCAVGKIAGATGSHAALGVAGIEIQNRVLTRLGLGSPVATTQIVQRDRLAEAILSMANLCASLDKIATDLRTLQRTELAETFEPFDRDRQVGSSAMPHKRNPVTLEKICGLARLVRSLAAPALENVVSWDERDISHSSTERFIIPQAFIITDYLLRETAKVISGLVIDTNAVARNLVISKDAILSEYVLTLLVQTGLDRPVVHEALRRISDRARQSGRSLIEELRDDEIAKHLPSGTRLDIESYYESIREVSRRIVNRCLTTHVGG